MDLYVDLIPVGGLTKLAIPSNYLEVLSADRPLSVCLEPTFETFLLPLSGPGVYNICETARLGDHILCFQMVPKCLNFSVQDELDILREKRRILQISIQLPAHPVYFMRYNIKIHLIKRLLLHVQDYVEGSLFYLEGLERLNMGKIFLGGMLALEFAHWTSCPSEIGLNGVNMVFPAVTLPLKFIHAKA